MQVPNLKYLPKKQIFLDNFLSISDSMTVTIFWAMLEHSSPNLTNKVYANVDPVLRHGVDQLPR
jgi:hypothetical protein